MSLKDNISKWLKRKNKTGSNEVQKPETSANNLLAPIRPASSTTAFTISADIVDLIWFGDGVYKNYTPPARKAAPPGTITVFTAETYEEPSALYLSLPVSEPAQGTLIERRPTGQATKNLHLNSDGCTGRFFLIRFHSKIILAMSFCFITG